VRVTRHRRQYRESGFVLVRTPLTRTSKMLRDARTAKMTDCNAACRPEGGGPVRCLLRASQGLCRIEINRIMRHAPNVSRVVVVRLAAVWAILHWSVGPTGPSSTRMSWRGICMTISAGRPPSRNIPCAGTPRSTPPAPVSTSPTGKTWRKKRPRRGCRAGPSCAPPCC
jgi:hypothetical protein